MAVAFTYAIPFVAEMERAVGFYRDTLGARCSVSWVTEMRS